MLSTDIIIAFLWNNKGPVINSYRLLKIPLLWGLIFYGIFQEILKVYLVWKNQGLDCCMWNLNGGSKETHKKTPKAVPRAAADFVWQLKITDTQIKVMSLATEWIKIRKL